MRALLRFNMHTSCLPAGVATVLLLAGCSVPSLPIPTNIPYTQSWSGTAMSEWRVTFTGQVIADQGKPYLGITSHP